VFVLDSSTTCSCSFRDEKTPETEAIRKRLFQEEAVVPAIWPTEISNTLLQGIRRKRLSVQDAEAFIDLLDQASITIEPPSSGLQTLLSSALAHGLTVYDATYLELAIREGLPLATLDKQLREAAIRTGVTLLP
jgi:predicted nucleic acid-binding protein